MARNIKQSVLKFATVALEQVWHRQRDLLRFEYSWFSQNHHLVLRAGHGASSNWNCLCTCGRTALYDSQSTGVLHVFCHSALCIWIWKHRRDWHYASFSNRRWWRCHHFMRIVNTNQHVFSWNDLQKISISKYLFMQHTNSLRPSDTCTSVD